MSDDWGTLAEHHADRVFRAARSLLHDDESAWDCVQEAFLTAVMSRRPDDLTEPVAWLCGVARNHARHLSRGRGRFRALLERLAAARLSRVETKGRDSREALTEGLGKLPPQLREAVVLRYFGRMSLAEVAGMQGVSETAAKSRVHRGLGRLRAVLGTMAVLVLLVRESGRGGVDAAGTLLAAAKAAAPVGLATVGGATALKFAGALLLVTLGATVFLILPKKVPFSEPPPEGAAANPDPGSSRMVVGMVPGEAMPKAAHGRAAPGTPGTSTLANLSLTVRDLADGAFVPDFPLEILKGKRVTEVVSTDSLGRIHLRLGKHETLRAEWREWRLAGDPTAVSSEAGELFVYRMIEIEGTVQRVGAGRSRGGPHLFAMAVGLPESTLENPTPEPWHPDWLAAHGIARSVPLEPPDRMGRFSVTVPAIRGMAVVVRAPGYHPGYARIDPPARGAFAKRIGIKLTRCDPVEGELVPPGNVSRSRRRVELFLTEVVDRSQFRPEELGIPGHETIYVTLPNSKKVAVTRCAIGETDGGGQFSIDPGGEGYGAVVILEQDNSPFIAIERRFRLSGRGGKRIGRMRAQAVHSDGFVQFLVGGIPASGVRLLLLDLKRMKKSAGVVVTLTKNGTMPRGLLERPSRTLVLVIDAARSPAAAEICGVLQKPGQKPVELTALPEFEAALGVAPR